ncbi:DegV family protein [Spiroplasma culicicola]|uniref:DegV family protein n=1 Tax=Spiroplasma culicicola AES-1 TaxID=1276246 RepID=W6A6S3_9MOLU|nr:DegV family protein [Spiroplasma culicicola]AHI52671.1 DegV family protein [Spiroplasma culicicola AES-1]
MKTAIIIDSSVGLKDLSNYQDLYLVPLLINLEDESTIKDDITLNREQFYKLNDSQVLKTSQSLPGDMLAKWDELLKDYDQIICLLLSKGLSGQYNTFKMFSQEDEYKDKVFVVDTNGVSVVLNRQLEICYELLKNNTPIEQIVEAIENKYKDFKGYIIPRSLTQLVRGGRITKAAAGLAKILKITPILKYNGEIDKEDKTRTFKKAVEIVLDKIIKDEKDFILDISYSQVEQSVLDEVLQLVEQKGITLGLLKEMPNVIVCHTGRETFAFIPYSK